MVNNQQICEIIQKPGTRPVARRRHLGLRKTSPRARDQTKTNNTLQNETFQNETFQNDIIKPKSSKKKTVQYHPLIPRIPPPLSPYAFCFLFSATCFTSSIPCSWYRSSKDSVILVVWCQLPHINFSFLVWGAYLYYPNLALRASRVNRL